MDNGRLPPPKKIFIWYYYFEGPISYSLYCIDASNDICSHKKIHEFKRDKFPEEGKGIFAVAGGTRLYLIGGDRTICNTKYNRKRIYPREVHEFDMATHRIKNAPPMHGGKCSPLVVSVMGGRRIYVLSYVDCLIADNPSPTFEYFDPISRQWNLCPQPPFYFHSPGGQLNFDMAVISHAVVETHNIIVSTGRHEIYLYDVLRAMWRGVYGDGDDYLPFLGRAVFVRNTWFGLPMHGLVDATVFAFDFNSKHQRFVGGGRPVQDFKPLKPTLLPSCTNFYEDDYSCPHSELLDLGNGRLCILMFDDDDQTEREPHVLLSTFHVIEEEKEESSSSSSSHKKRKRGCAAVRLTYRSVHQRRILCDLSGGEATIHRRLHCSGDGCIFTSFTASA